MDNATLLAHFAAYLKGKRLAATTIRNRLSILSGLGRRTELLTTTTFELRGFVGQDGIKAGSARTYRGTVLAFYTFLVDEGLRDDNPALRLESIRAPKGTPRPFTPEQIDRMLTSGAYRKTRAMILLGCYQGFRVSQIARVRGDDVDVLSGTIRTIAKGSKSGVLPLHPVIRELAGSMPQSWWFPARDGSDRPMSSASVTDLITKAKLRAGITDPKLTPHSLRHSFGTDLVDAGVDIRIIQELMMHESLATTQIYTGISARLKREGIESLPVRTIPVRSGRWGDKIAA